MDKNLFKILNNEKGLTRGKEFYKKNLDYSKKIILIFSKTLFIKFKRITKLSLLTKLDPP